MPKLALTSVAKDVLKKRYLIRNSEASPPFRAGLRGKDLIMLSVQRDEELIQEHSLRTTPARSRVNGGKFSA